MSALPFRALVRLYPLFLLAACSSTTTINNAPPSGDGGLTGDASQALQGGTHKNGNGGTCCLNGAFYNCTSQAAYGQCAGFDIDACMGACSPSDPACAQGCMEKLSTAKHDPSACQRDPSKDGTCSISNNSGPSPSGCSSDIGLGSCSIDQDCPTGEHCTNGKCYDNAAGSLCTIDPDCGSGNHCTNGCCESNTSGSHCTIDGDCGSGNHCTNGSCYPNMFGSPCTINPDCGPGESCVNGQCSSG
jgi:hypothetical protein